MSTRADEGLSWTWFAPAVHSPRTQSTWIHTISNRQLLNNLSFLRFLRFFADYFHRLSYMSDSATPFSLHETCLMIRKLVGSSQTNLVRVIKSDIGFLVCCYASKSGRVWWLDGIRHTERSLRFRHISPAWALLSDWGLAIEPFLLFSFWDPFGPTNHTVWRAFGQGPFSQCSQVDQLVSLATTSTSWGKIRLTCRITYAEKNRIRIQHWKI